MALKYKSESEAARRQLLKISHFSTSIVTELSGRFRGNNELQVSQPAKIARHWPRGHIYTYKRVPSWINPTIIHGEIRLASGCCLLGCDRMETSRTKQVEIKVTFGFVIHHWAQVTARRSQPWGIYANTNGDSDTGNIQTQIKWNW